MARRHLYTPLIAIGLLMALAAPASAGGKGVTQISGVANFAEPGECPDPPDSDFDWLTIVFREGKGSLEGCWYTKLGSSKQNGAPSGIWQEGGEEIFVGSLNDGPEGTFTTTYKFTGKFDPYFDDNFLIDFVEIHGRCQHR
jgi:hypothetical protein